MESSLLSDFDLHLLAEGTHFDNYKKLGAHLAVIGGAAGTRFAVWAPNAEQVSVIGDFNGWNTRTHAMKLRPQAGVWELFVPGAGAGVRYKYHVASRFNGYQADKADPYGFAAEVRPRTASRVWDLSRYQWGDAEWMGSRAATSAPGAPISIYEVHLGSWMRLPGEGGWLTYRDLAPRLAEYAVEMAFTHVELMPVTEHPLDRSWGYQTVGYYAPTSRFGTPDEFMFLIDTLHGAGIGVILDWVPGHFPSDEHGLGFFDGTHLYEHEDKRQGHHPEWDTLIFNFGRREVANFLTGNGLFWFDVYHADGLRVDAVAAMLYLDYGREEGQWIPNEHGGHENLEAVAFLRQFNERVYAAHPDVMTFAEESTSWPMVSRPTDGGGLGFGYKWNMGWMNDVLEYMSEDPIHRKHHHDKLTFSMLYAFNENFVLPFSHDEVVHMKKSMLGKMPGDDWCKFANLRLLYGYMYGHPGKKLLFMGDEFGQRGEWDYDGSLDWRLLAEPAHEGLRQWVRDLNQAHRREPALHQFDFEPRGFEWIDCEDRDSSVISFLRRGRDPRDDLIVVCNFTPVPRDDYAIGAPAGGRWSEILNSDAALYGGSGVGNAGGAGATAEPAHGRPYRLTIVLPPLACVMFKRRRD